MNDSNMGKWDGWYKGLTLKDIGSFRYAETETYKMGAEFLNDMDCVEDWGCGVGGFKRFCTTKYVGVDGSHTPFADKIVDLVNYQSSVDGIMMRHVLEHNYEWKKLLDNAVSSFNKKMFLVLFVPFSDGPTKEVGHEHNTRSGVDVPDLALNKEELEIHFKGLKFRSQTLKTVAGYGEETVYYLEK
jgi:hypothetical protein